MLSKVSSGACMVSEVPGDPLAVEDDRIDRVEAERHPLPELQRLIAIENSHQLTACRQFHIDVGLVAKSFDETNSTDQGAVGGNAESVRADTERNCGSAHHAGGISHDFGGREVLA